MIERVNCVLCQGLTPFFLGEIFVFPLEKLIMDVPRIISNPALISLQCNVEKILQHFNNKIFLT